MAAKRSLYRPAQLESVGSKEISRSPLVQGRLVTKPVIPDTMTVYASPAVDITSSQSNIVSDISITASHSTFGREGFSTPPRQSLANLSHQNLGSQSYTLASKAQQSPGSPSKPTPSDILDLSDGDTDRHSKPSIVHIQHSSKSPVLMVDAGGRQRDPDVSEVEIRTDMVASPAKVICHAPAVVESDLRNTGYTQEATKVQVDSIPSVSLHGNLDVTADQPITRENTQLQRTKLVQVVKENHDTLTGTLPSQARDLSGTSDESMARETSASSVDNSKSMTQQHRKKKTKGKVVASRYMSQTTTSVKMKASTANQSSLSVTRRRPARPESIHRPSSSVRQTTKPVTRKTSKSSARVTTKPSISDTTIHTERKGSESGRTRTSKPSLSDTIMDGRKGSVSGGVTSTPAVNLSRLPSRSGLDASVIQPIHGMSVLMSEDMSMIAQLSQTDSSPSHRGDVDVTNITHTASHKKHSKEPEITQDYLDRLYARYLQWVYVDSKLRKSFQEQEKDAMGQIFALWCENEKMRKHKAELELDLARIKHENHLDEQLEIQRAGLGPITANSDPYRSQYSTMAHALDTTRHQLPLKGIYVPEDEEQYQDALIAALDESEQLLQQLNLTVGSTQGSKVSSFSKAMQTLENVVENEDKELKRCQELLAATSSLTTHASSLQIQQLEAQG